MGISAVLGSSALLPAGLGFRNLIINGDFRVNQRALSSTGVTASGTYGFDRWRNGNSGGTATYSAQTFSLGNAITGFEPTNYARMVTASQSAVSDYAALLQKIEGVRTCAGQTVTISFWAQAGSGTPKVAVELIQSFGTGGSPSSDVTTYVGQATLSTTWARYSFTIIVPSISGKTLGTAGDDCLILQLWTSAGSNFNSRTGSLGIQNTTINFWGVQVEQNYQATPFEQRPLGVELALCQRYYYRTGGNVASDIYISGYQPASTNIIYTYFHPVPMRATPSIAQRVGTWSLINTPDQPIVSGASSLSYFVYIKVNASISNANQSAAYTSGSTTYIEMGAEL